MRIVFFLFLIFLLSSCTYLGLERRPSYAKIAAECRAEKRYDEAIENYQKHIAARLEDTRREADENPHFYLILIGDVYLDSGRIEQALESYLEAKQKKVEIPLLVDRIRRVAGVLREQKKYKEAIELLKQHRELDEFVFDLDIDENMKELVKIEDNSNHSGF